MFVITFNLHKTGHSYMSSVEDRGFESPVGSSQRLKKLAPAASLVSVHH